MADNDSKRETKRTKILYIVFSIIASIALWMYVVKVDNPDRDITLYSVPVTFSGEEILTDNNLVVVDINVKKLSMSFKGKWNELSNLSSSDVTAVVNLDDIVSDYSAAAGTYQLSYDLKYADGISKNSITKESASYDFVTVTVEKLVSVSVPVVAAYDGGVASGYTAEAPEVSSDTITVSGPQSILNQISYASVKLNRENLSKSVSENVAVVLMNENDIPIEDESITLSQDEVTVSVKVLMVKNIPLTVKLVESASATESNTRCTINPTYITVSGDPEVLSEFNSLVIGTVDLTEFSTVMTEDYPIALPNDVNNLTGTVSAEVNVEVIGMSTRKLSVTNIQRKNLTDGYAATMITQSLDVTIRGPEGVIEMVEADNIRVVADLTELGNTTGTFSVPARVYVDGFNKVDAIGDYKVSVTITVAD